MSKVKFQHYVPRFYLKQFSNKSKSNIYFIYCYDKTNSKIFPTNINRAAGSNYYYDEKDLPFKPMERTLTNIESKYKVIHKKILKFQDLSILRLNELIMFGIFIVTQEIRTPGLRELMKSIIKVFKKTSEEKEWDLSEELKNQIERNLEDEKLKEYQISMFNNLAEFVFFIIQMKWLLLKNKTDYPLWTSDNPIVRWNPIDLSPYGNLGYLSRGIEINFPLSSTLCLCICDPIKYDLIPSINDMFDKQNIIHLNWLQVVRSTRFLYSNVSDFSLAEEYLSKYPEFRDPDRPRISVQ